MSSFTQVVALTDFAPNTTAQSAQVDANFAAIRSVVNALVTGSNAINADTIAEVTSAGGVTIDSVLLKDGAIKVTGSQAVAAGTVGKEAVTGLAIVGVTGSTYDMTLYYATGAGFLIANPTGTDDLIIGETGSTKLGFYGHAVIAQQTGVAVTAGGIHAALVALGLITA